MLIGFRGFGGIFKFEIYQYIKFDTSGKIFTYVNTPIGKIKIYDNWVHIKKCKPFMVRYYYTTMSTGYPG